jgi:histidyl-tRNA synthetase
MSEKDMFPARLSSSPADVMVAIWNNDSVSQSIELAKELRAAGLRVDLYPEADKLGKQFKYAAALGVSFVAILGEEESAKGQVALKNMRTGEQQAVMRNDLHVHLENLVNHVKTDLKENDVK